MPAFPRKATRRNPCGASVADTAAGRNSRASRPRLPPSSPARHHARMAITATNLPTDPSCTDPVVVNCIAYGATAAAFGDICSTKSATCWQHAGSSYGSACTNRTGTCCEKLQEEFDLHELAIEDAHNAHQRPKIEIYGDSLFMVVHTAQVVDGQHRVRRDAHLLRAALSRHRAPRRLAVVRAARDALRAGARSARAGPQLRAVCGARLHRRQLLPDRRRIPRGTATSWKRTSSRKPSSRETIRRLYDLKKELITLRLAIAPMQDIVNQLMRLYPRLVRDEIRAVFPRRLRPRRAHQRSHRHHARDADRRDGA